MQTSPESQMYQSFLEGYPADLHPWRDTIQTLLQKN